MYFYSYVWPSAYIWLVGLKGVGWSGLCAVYWPSGENNLVEIHNQSKVFAHHRFPFISLTSDERNSVMSPNTPRVSEGFKKRSLAPDLSVFFWMVITDTLRRSDSRRRGLFSFMQIVHNGVNCNFSVIVLHWLMRPVSVQYGTNPCFMVTLDSAFLATYPASASSALMLFANSKILSLLWFILVSV